LPETDPPEHGDVKRVFLQALHEHGQGRPEFYQSILVDDPFQPLHPLDRLGLLEALQARPHLLPQPRKASSLATRLWISFTRPCSSATADSGTSPYPRMYFGRHSSGVPSASDQDELETRHGQDEGQ
jgi:hypothetical protein